MPNPGASQLTEGELHSTGAALPPPTPVAATGASFLVDTKESPLRVRSQPRISELPHQNVIAHLPDGHPVRAIDGKVENGFIEIETSLFGAHLTGFVAAEFLRATDEPLQILALTPQDAPAKGDVPAAHMPDKPAAVRRKDRATAHSLKEADQPSRSGPGQAKLIRELNEIIDWLNVDLAAHARYRPRDGLTFCNIYAHDFCHLAGAYLPRVWWTESALLNIAKGNTPPALIGNTLREMRANDLFRWLRDFGLTFGWRQTGTLDKLQTAANAGGIGMIVARRTHDGKPGHIVVVVPESNGAQARRDPKGNIVSPLQSQAGAVNFKRSTPQKAWWKGAQFAESAFWIHS